MSARYSMADWGELISSREFKRRYNGCPFKGDGWYLLSIAGGENVLAAILAQQDGDAIRTRGWFVPDLEMAKQEIAGSGFSELPIREQEF